MDWTTGNHPTVRGTTGDDAYPRPLGAADPLGAARATMAAIDAISAPLMRAMEQSERELGIVAEHQAAEQRVVDEAAPTGSRVEIFDDSATFGLLAEFDAELRLDGYQTTIGVRRNATGRITGVAIHLSRQQPEQGR